MLYSQLVGKTIKETPKDEESRSAQYLLRGGYIYKEIAGAYCFLPLGYKVLQKIVDVIRDEMEKIDGQEVTMSSLQNANTWKTTNRWDDEVVDIWFKTKISDGKETGLAFTHEEPLTKLMTQQISSYKDLPKYVFQFQTKFRNEKRAKGGLLRTREFLMKDLYSFNKDKETHEEYYERAKQAYINIWNRLGIGEETYLTFASGGSFGKYSHEFQTICEAGEDTIYVSKEKNIAVNKEVYEDEVLKDLDLTKDDLTEMKGIEVGNIFPLGTKFSDSLGLKYVDENGEMKPVVMGSYGIGPGRVMSTIVELKSDDKGIIWPENVAPYKVHLVGLNLDNETVKEKATSLYKLLQEKNIEVLFDDREKATAGEKFATADLLGMPLRLVVSAKTGDNVEFKKRDSEEATMLSIEEILEKVA